MFLKPWNKVGKSKGISFIQFHEKGIGGVPTTIDERAIHLQESVRDYESNAFVSINEWMIL